MEFEPRNLSGEKSTYGMIVVFKMCYFMRQRGTNKWKKFASIGHLEIFSMSSGERLRKSRGTWKEQERYKRYLRGRTGAHEMNNRGTEDVQQGNMRWTAEVQQRPFTELKIHNTKFFIYMSLNTLYTKSSFNFFFTWTFTFTWTLAIGCAGLWYCMKAISNHNSPRIFIRLNISKETPFLHLHVTY